MNKIKGMATKLSFKTLFIYMDLEDTIRYNKVIKDVAAKNSTTTTEVLSICGVQGDKVKKSEDMDFNNTAILLLQLGLRGEEWHKMMSWFGYRLCELYKLDQYILMIVDDGREFEFEGLYDTFKRLELLDC